MPIRPPSRRQFCLSVAGGAVATAAWAGGVEPRWLEVTERCVPMPRVRPERPVRLLHLADFHASFFVPMPLIEEAVRVGVALRPDLICLTGDFITRGTDLDFARYVRALTGLSAAAPTFAVLGNHDGGTWAGDRRGQRDHKLVAGLLEESSIRLLQNQNAESCGLSLAGAADLWSNTLDGGKTFNGLDTRRPVVLLAHNPDTKEEVARQPWDLMLSGHTHGGQVVLPWAGPHFAPVVDRRYIAGLKPWGDRLIHVTRGVGSLGGVRFRCRPEASLLVVE